MELHSAGEDAMMLYLGEETSPETAAARAGCHRAVEQALGSRPGGPGAILRLAADYLRPAGALTTWTWRTACARRCQRCTHDRRPVAAALCCRCTMTVRWVQTWRLSRQRCGPVHRGGHCAAFRHRISRLRHRLRARLRLSRPGRRAHRRTAPGHPAAKGATRRGRHRRPADRHLPGGIPRRLEPDRALPGALCSTRIQRALHAREQWATGCVSKPVSRERFPGAGGSPGMSLQVLQPGILSLLQDSGRRGQHRHRPDQRRPAGQRGVLLLQSPAG